MNSFFAYYLAWIFLSYVLRTPWLLLGIVVILVLRRFIPDPGSLLRMLSRARSLRGQVEVNRANITARRDLAVLYLDGRRARAALPLLEQGLALSPDDPELLYLFGLALHRVGRHEEALAPLVRAVELDPRVRYGLPYVVAGDALAALKRWDGALDAYERYLADNSSDVSAYTRLSRAQARTGDKSGARETLREGLRTWGVLPSAMKRRQFGAYLRAQWARVTVLGEPAAIAVAFGLAALFAIAARYAYAPVVSLFSSSSGRSSGRYSAYASTPEQRALFDGFERCGTQSTGNFAGRYAVIAETRDGSPSPSSVTEAPLERGADFDERWREQYANFEIRRDRIVSGTGLIQEFCLSRVLDRTPTRLRAEAVWHEDVHDPGDASLVVVTLERDGDVTTMKYSPLEGPKSPYTLRLRRE